MHCVFCAFPVCSHDFIALFPGRVFQLWKSESLPAPTLQKTVPPGSSAVLHVFLNIPVSFFPSCSPVSLLFSPRLFVLFSLCLTCKFVFYIHSFSITLPLTTTYLYFVFCFVKWIKMCVCTRSILFPPHNFLFSHFLLRVTESFMALNGRSVSWGTLNELSLNI